MTEKEVVVQGKTVKDATQTACKLLNVEERQLLVEVLEPGDRRFFRLKKKAAIIRVRVLIRPDSASIVGQRQEEYRDGLIGVVGGKLQIIEPFGKGELAMLIPTDGVKLRINGVIINNASEIRPGDSVEVEMIKEIQDAGLEIIIASDELTASVMVTPENILSHELIDQKPQKVIQLITRLRVESRQVINFYHIEKALVERGIKFGLDRDALERAVVASDGCPYVVAQGDLPLEGQNGFVEYLFSREPISSAIDHEEQVKYWDHFVYPSVQVGQVLAVLHPPVKGRPGRKVTGEVIQPQDVYSASLNIKEGVILSEDGYKAIAKIPGRPVLEGYKNPCLKIIKLMVHQGDVDVKSGNLHFHGDILILGNVHEGMQVVANGDITLLGDAEGALLLAGGSVYCRGRLFKSRVKASGMQVFYSSLAPQVEALGQVIDSLLQEIQVLEQQLTYRKGIVTESDRRQLLALLTARRNKEINNQINSYLAILKGAGIPLPSIVWNMAVSVKRLTGISDPSDSLDLEELVQLAKKKEEIEELLRSLPIQPGDLLCSYAQSCTLEASGNIIIEGQGCLGSNITAGKKVKVWGTFRGGEILATEGIFIEEVGTSGSTVGTARMRVGAAGKISLNRVYPEVVIQIGQKSYVLDEMQNYVNINLSQRGQLEITSSKFNKA